MMAKARLSKQTDYQSLEGFELVWLAQLDNNKQAIDEIYARKTEIARRIARNYCRKYTFVDEDDLSQSMLLGLPKIIRTYRPGKAGTSWDKYCYHRLTFLAKDVLRQRDDLGIGWPQKKMYPEWYHLGDESLDGFDPKDFRELDQDTIDLERFYTAVAEARDALDVSRVHVNPKPSRAAVHDLMPTAWYEGKYYGRVEVSTARKSNKQSLAQDIARWKVQRSKPKQLVMW